MPAPASAVDRWFEVRVSATGNSTVAYAGGRLAGSYRVTWDWQMIGIVRYRGDDFEPEESITRYQATEQSDVSEGGRLIGCRGSKRPVATLSTPEGRRSPKGARGDFVRTGQLALDDGQMFVSAELGPSRRNCEHRHKEAHDLEGLTGFGEEFESPIQISEEDFDPRGTKAFSRLFRKELTGADQHETAPGEEPHSFAGSSAARVSIKPLSAALAKRRIRERAKLPEPR